MIWSCFIIMNDVMENNEDDLSKDFEPFARKYSTSIITHWSGEVLRYNSTHLKPGCAFIKGAILSPNCIAVSLLIYYFIYNAQNVLYVVSYTLVDSHENTKIFRS